eukprot:s3073_g15.t1
MDFVDVADPTPGEGNLLGKEERAQWDELISELSAGRSEAGVLPMASRKSETKTALSGGRGILWRPHACRFSAEWAQVVGTVRMETVSRSAGTAEKDVGFLRFDGDGLQLSEDVQHLCAGRMPAREFANGNHQGMEMSPECKSTMPMAAAPSRRGVLESVIGAQVVQRSEQSGFLSRRNGVRDRPTAKLDVVLSLEGGIAWGIGSSRRPKRSEIAKHLLV